MEENNQAYEESEIIFENDRFLIVKPLTQNAAAYFGARWLGNHLSENSYIIIDKNAKEQGEIEPFVLIYRNDALEFYEGVNEMTSKEFFQKFPELEKVIFDNIATSNTYSALMQIAQGKQFSDRELNEIDPLLTKITFNKNKPKSSLLSLTFDDVDDFYRVLGYNDEDISFLRQLFGYYSDLGFFNSDSAWEDWKEGYIVRHFNDENIATLKKITTLLNPKLVDFDDDENVSTLCKLLHKLYPRYSDNIMNEYQYKMENCYEETAKESINNEISNPFEIHGIFEVRPHRKFVTSVSILISLYNEKNIKEQDLESLLKNLVKDQFYGNFYENMYDYGCSDFDNEGFNKTVENELDNILTEVEEGVSENFLKLLEVISSNYILERWYSLPRENGSKFYIEKFDPKTEKVIIRYMKKNSSTERRSYDLEGFLNFLNNPELFD